MAFNIENNRWSTEPDQFAVRITIPDLNGFFQRLPNLPKGRTLIIEPGTRALVIDEGYVAGELRGGSYTLESFIERLQFWQNRQVTVILTREEDIPLEMQAENVPCVDSVCFDIKYRWTIQIQEAIRFLDNLMGARNEVSISELSELLAPIANQAVQSTVGRLNYDAIKSADFLNLLSDGMRSHLETRLTRYGLALTDLQSATAHSDADGLQVRRGEQWLRSREVQLQQAATAVENEELRAKLDDIQSKVSIRQQLRDEVNSDHLNKYQSKEDFAKALLEIDKQQVLRKEERDELIEAYEARKEDREQLREHLLATIDILREQELEELRVETDYAVRQKSLQKELELSALTNSMEAQQWRHELQKEVEQAEHRRQQKLESVKASWQRIREVQQQKRDVSWESLLHEQKMEGVRAELQVAKAERERRVALIQAELQSRLAAEKLEMQKRQQEWELEHKQKRSENQLDRMQKLQEMNAQFAERQQRMQLEMENLRADSASKRELERI
ncbi:MAG: SPFH domain-containing protein, partial [Planctomycetaceae bacterium]|nr:SPFH domain-containing protein [Planctomycetaceae bacterium]